MESPKNENQSSSLPAEERLDVEEELGEVRLHGEGVGHGVVPVVLFFLILKRSVFILKECVCMDIFFYIYKKGACMYLFIYLHGCMYVFISFKKGVCVWIVYILW